MERNDAVLADRLATVADMVNDPAIGPDSPELDAYINRFAEDAEFIQLANLSRRLGRSLSQVPPVDHAALHDVQE